MSVLDVKGEKKVFPSRHTREFVTGSDYSRSTRQGCSLWFHGSLSSNVCSDKCKDFFKAVSDKPPSIFTYFYYKEFFDQVLDHRWLRTGNLYPCIFFSLFYLRRRLFLSFKVIVLCPESVMIYLRKKKFTLLREVLFPRGAASSTLTTSGF